MPADPIRVLDNAKVALGELAGRCREPAPTAVSLMTLGSSLRSWILNLSDLIDAAALDGRRQGGSNRSAEALLLLEHFKELEEGVAQTLAKQQDLVAKREAAEIDANGSTRRALRASRALLAALMSEEPSRDSPRAAAPASAPSQADFDAAWAVAFDLPPPPLPPPPPARALTPAVPPHFAAPLTPPPAPRNASALGDHAAGAAWVEGTDEDGWGDGLDFDAAEESAPCAAPAAGQVNAADPSAAAAVRHPPSPPFDPSEARRLRDAYIRAALEDFRSRTAGEGGTSGGAIQRSASFVIGVLEESASTDARAPIAGAVAALRRGDGAEGGGATPRSAFGTPSRRAAAAAAAGGTGPGGLRPSATQASAFSISSTSALAPVLLPRDTDTAASAADRLQFPVSYNRCAALGATVPSAAGGAATSPATRRIAPSQPRVSMPSQAPVLPSPRHALEPSLVAPSAQREACQAPEVPDRRQGAIDADAAARALLFSGDEAREAQRQASSLPEEDLSAELLELVSAMKARSLEVLDRLRSDNAALDSTATMVEANVDAVGDANERLARQLGASCGSLCSTLGMLVVASLLFVAAYIAVRYSAAPPPWIRVNVVGLCFALVRGLYTLLAALVPAAAATGRMLLVAVQKSGPVGSVDPDGPGVGVEL